MDITVPCRSMCTSEAYSAQTEVVASSSSPSTGTLGDEAGVESVRVAPHAQEPVEVSRYRMVCCLRVSPRMAFPLASSLALPPQPGPAGMEVLGCEAALHASLVWPPEASFPSLQVRTPSAPRRSLWDWARAPPSPDSLLGVQTDGPAEAGRAFCLPWLLEKRFVLTFCFDCCILTRRAGTDAEKQAWVLNLHLATAEMSGGKTG